MGMVNVVDNGIGGRPDGTVAVSIPLPVFNRNQGAFSQTRNELTAAQQALAQLDLDHQQRLAPVFERYSNARSQVERYHTTILPTALESLELTRQTYAGGESSFVGLLTSQRTYSQTNLNYLEALRELRTSEAEIPAIGQLAEPQLNQCRSGALSAMTFRELNRRRRRILEAATDSR